MKRRAFIALVGSFLEQELVSGNEVISPEAGLSVAALKRVTRTVPIVFMSVADPVGGGFVDSLARPGGNVSHSLLEKLVHWDETSP